MPTPILSFKDVLIKFRDEAFSERDKGYKFEKLMKAYLEIAPEYNGKFKEVWLWGDFPYRMDFSGKDTGIDLVALTTEGDYWAIQCKCYSKDARITKDGVDSFLATSSKEFFNDKMQTTRFAYRLWISTTNNWNSEAEKTIQNQNPPVLRIGLSDLETALVDWDKLVNGDKDALLTKYPLREHQKTAVDKAHEYFKTAERGKLIMACGTGKTFTSLRIAENETDSKGIVLFLVPSIALLGQTLREWTAQSELPIHPICICSDSKASQDKDSDGSIVDLALPASTDVKSIARQYLAAKMAQEKNGGMIVVFSTYQSIDVISQAQVQINRQDKDSCIFDLVVCDEAHRTTGVILSDKEESYFTKIHDNDWIQAKKRLYMTATPRLYTDASKQKAQEGNAILCSMDDPVIYGEEIYRIGFGEAVKKDLLSDYKVLILTIKEDQIPVALQNVIKDKNNEIDTDDISKLIGCINALSKRVLETDESFNDDKQLMHTAVAFCQNINISKKITNMFNQHKDAYYDSLTQEERAKLVGVYADHIDGSMGASVRAEKLSWLKDVSQDSKDCHILCNVKCLSEGVDVPSLDAVMFLSAKNSQVDVVQSVGRVMRKSRTTDKKYGYIIIPIVIPADVAPEVALDDNERYKVVWSVLNALRSHDDRFDAEINQIDLNKKKGKRIRIVGVGDNTRTPNDGDDAEQLSLPYLEKLQDAMYAKMVKKVGNRMYWVQWAQDVARIAEQYIKRINRLIAQEGKHKKAFDALLKGLRKNINPSITQDAVVQMLAQHLITQPVFEALFENYSFVANNPVSKSLQKMVALLEEQSFDKDTEFLNKFYDSVKERVKGIDNAEGKQKVIVELYDKFFKTAFPKVVEQLGIVYTPVEVVDFINHSVAKVLKKEFNRNLSDENVHILDPFTGTGTFITRLIQTGLIDKEALPRKYAKELHANEIVLLAYYIASINIENAYHDAVGMDNGYKSFNGICLTDTFQLGESDNADELFSDMLPQNSQRVMEQKKLPVRVIIGNPPYSVGQKDANDNAQNQKYPKLDDRIADTYVKGTSATNANKLYDSYIRAFRWASDRLDKENGGIIGFITNGIWLDNNSFDGFRKCLEKEFTSIYTFNLRGGIKGKSGDNAKREGQNVFDIMTGVAITILVKNPKQHTDKATIYYHDIGEYLKRTEKLGLLSKFENISSPKIGWKALKPNEHGDWLNQRSDLFSSYIPIDASKKYNIGEKSYFITYSLGLATGRDSWCYNFNYDSLKDNIQRTIQFYNSQSKDYANSNKKLSVDDFIDTDKTKISWNRNLKEDLEKGKIHSFNESHIILSQYRPFCKQHLYFDKDMNAMLYQQPKLYPTTEHRNICICVSSDVRNGCSVLITDKLPDLSFVPGAQCFPLYYYEKNEGNIGTLFDNGNENYVRRDAITDFIFEQCRERYGHKVMKEDIFYYVYGLLHSKDYREQFAADLKKMLPRIPLVDKPADFWAFSKAGRDLADLHLNYETIPAYKDAKVIGADIGKFRVEKLTFGKNGKEVDKSVIVYNSYIRIENIPLEAYDYVVNGKSAIEWIMDRYQIKTDKDSGITNDPNDWGLEHNNPRYILDLILSIITVSIETNKIVNSLPKLDLK
ncbi:MAG: DEAD/DEAH box helicase family protein [Alphaproteobacteria bacterium]|nr:DEAD/DEAH box helicase family protein [Alphaproteobacteria bacterium]